MTKYMDITETIGSTPLVKLNRIAPDNCEIYCKLEFFNPLSSIKDRAALSIIDAAEKNGTLQPGGTLIEATSGNTGLGLAMVAAARGYKLIITMPESMSVERRALLKILGAELVLTPAMEGMNGAVYRAEELGKSIPGAVLTRQFDNPANPDIHYRTTGPEIWQDCDGRIDAVVVGIGTGGTITGAGRFLKGKNNNIKIIGVEPASSAVIAGNPPGRHGIQGIGAGFIPGNFDCAVVDEVLQVCDDSAIDIAKKMAGSEGILCGISSGAAVAAALKLAERPEYNGKVIVVIIPDTGERYLSTPLFEKM